MAYNLLETYLQEAEDLLGEIERSALALSGGDSQQETINQLFRAFHTIKGSGAMCGLERVAGFTHHVETVLDSVREGTLAVTPRLVELVLAARDHIQLLLATEHGGAVVPVATSDELVACFQQLAGAPPVAAAAPVGASAPGSPAGHITRWRIRFRPNPELLACGGNPSLLFRDLAKLGPCQVQAQTGAVPTLASIRPDTCYLWWTIDLETSAGEDAIRDVFIFVEDGSDLEIETLARSEDPAPAAPSREASAIPVEVPEQREKIPVHTATPDGVRKALAKEATVRVPSARLDRLVNLVGELVMNQSRLAQAALQSGAVELANPVQELERLVSELRDNVLGIRMLPIGTNLRPVPSPGT